jgi:hypothetical protein
LSTKIYILSCAHISFKIIMSIIKSVRAPQRTKSLLPGAPHSIVTCAIYRRVCPTNAVFFRTTTLNTLGYLNVARDVWCVRPVTIPIHIFVNIKYRDGSTDLYMDLLYKISSELVQRFLLFFLENPNSYVDLFAINAYISCQPGSSVGILSGYGLDDRAIEVRSPVEAKGFFSNLCVQTGSGAHPPCCTTGTGSPLSGGKARPGRGADHSPPSSAEVEND